MKNKKLPEKLKILQEPEDETVVLTIKDFNLLVGKYNALIDYLESEQ